MSFDVSLARLALLSSVTALCMYHGPRIGEAADRSSSGPFGGGGTVMLEPVPARAVAMGRRPIFVCRDSSPVVYSDLPCEQQQQSKAPDVARARSGRVTTAAPPGPAANTALRSASDQQGNPAKQDICRQTHLQLTRLDEKMREGYAAAESAGLWSKWHELQTQLRDNRC
jgi:hypothetical protein